jgi:hypothetical protein
LEQKLQGEEMRSQLMCEKGVSSGDVVRQRAQADEARRSTKPRMLLEPTRRAAAARRPGSLDLGIRECVACPPTWVHQAALDLPAVALKVARERSSHRVEGRLGRPAGAAQAGWGKCLEMSKGATPLCHLASGRGRTGAYVIFNRASSAWRWAGLLATQPVPAQGPGV